MDYNRVYVIVKDASEDKYKYLADYFREIEDKIEQSVGERVEVLTIIDDFDKIPDLDTEIDATKQNIIIFDDIVTNKNQDKVIEMYIRGRKRIRRFCICHNHSSKSRRQSV
jgi:hypothetical protein